MKEELAQLGDIFNPIEEINQEVLELDDDYIEELWFPDNDEKVFPFKREVCNGLKKEIRYRE